MRDAGWSPERRFPGPSHHCEPTSRGGFPRPLLRARPAKATWFLAGITSYVRAGRALATNTTCRIPVTAVSAEASDNAQAPRNP